MQRLLQTAVTRQSRDLRIGIEIAQSAVKLAAVRRHAQDRTLERFLVGPLPHGAVVDGRIRNPEAVVEALRRLRVKSGLPRTEIVTALPDAAVQFKVLRVERNLPARETMALARREARTLIRDPQIPLAVDVASLGSARIDDELRDLLLVAAKTVDVRHHAELFRRAGWQPTILEVDSMVARHGIGHPLVHYDSGAPVVAVFDLGAGGIHLSVLRGDHPLFHRAQRWDPDRFDVLAGPSSESFIDTVRSLVQAFHRHTGIEHLDQLQVTGGLSLDAHWVTELADWIGMPVEPWRAEAVVQLGRGVQEMDPLQLRSQAFVPLSLALRGFE